MESCVVTLAAPGLQTMMIIGGLSWTVGVIEANGLNDGFTGRLYPTRGDDAKQAFNDHPKHRDGSSAG